ncbi:GntR family transcriptional regulator [Bradyrhizobium prioriisuperbiae]|uniref:GntR family transcriptional regulator n=1 Tax=Bradyrhizobium prioriisuperbiae TaxID=2854389 RepID=UPI0028EF6A1E|nr:GntR family transcriptional regulator [Bradyrhizobium prioritasuperba]
MNGTKISKPAPSSLIDGLKLREDTAMPLYRQLEEQLVSMIKQGRLAPGATMPAERHLAAELGLSRTTVQHCYDALRKRRLLAAHGRLGYIVQKSETVLEPGMNRLKGFTQEMQELGRTPSSRILERQALSDRLIASIFGLPSTARFLKLIRVRLGDGIPLSREIAWYSLDACQSLEHADLSGSIYTYLAEHGAPPAHCEQTIEATSPDMAECAIFGFTEPLPSLLIKRRTYDQTNRMLEYVEGLFRGDSYAYRLKMKV